MSRPIVKIGLQGAEEKGSPISLSRRPAIEDGEWQVVRDGQAAGWRHAEPADSFTREDDRASEPSCDLSLLVPVQGGVRPRRQTLAQPIGEFVHDEWAFRRQPTAMPGDDRWVCVGGIDHQVGRRTNPTPTCKHQGPELTDLSHPGGPVADRDGLPELDLAR